MATFEGFDKRTLTFFRELNRHNNRPWFTEHKGEYERYVLAPAQGFVTAMGAKLATIAPGVQAIPKINKSIFRIYRDTRFSKDKTPYKPHVGMLFWEGPLAKDENSAFYFHLEPEAIWIGSGVWKFSKRILEAYRQAVLHPVHGDALAEALAKVRRRGYEIGGRRKKRVPPGFDPAHPRAELLLHDGLYAGAQTAVPDELFSPRIVDWAFRHFKKTLELHQWLTALVERSA